MACGAEHDDLPPSHSVRPELFATGFEFAEGPAFDAAGNLFAVNYRANGNIGRIAPDGTAAVFCDLRELAPVDGRLPQANGLKVDSQGRLIASDSGAGRLLRVAADGRMVEVLADSCEGVRFNSVNDVALDRAGNIYFSDPGGSNADNPVGAIYRYEAATGKVTRLADRLAFPNGLGVTPDQKHLCLSESQRFRLLIFDLAPDGTVSNQRVLIEFPTETQGNLIGGRHDPDGLIFDARGRLYVGMWTGGVINVVEVPSGQLLRQYDAGGSKATNVHFYGDYLYTTVASKEAIFRLKLGVKGFDYNAPVAP
ncbi:MAG: SMP-30/gluconolactonase/LRE family protein [Pirellulales bacterium]|nr:SMP-30/gluconolactonase/LRE family protein [Pirellulales bacterium]